MRMGNKKEKRRIMVMSTMAMRRKKKRSKLKRLEAILNFIN